MANKSAEAAAKAASPEDIKKQLVLTGADIVLLGESGELLVGGKNYNTAIISQIKEIQAPHFRAISSVAFHRVLDETKVNSRIVRSMVDQEYSRIDWNDPEINRDPDYLQKFVRQLGKQVQAAQQESGEPGSTKLRTFINNVVEGFATSPEGIDQLRKRSVMVCLILTFVFALVETPLAALFRWLLHVDERALDQRDFIAVAPRKL